jgi:hypothetical protein
MNSFKEKHLSNLKNDKFYFLNNQFIKKDICAGYKSNTLDDIYLFQKCHKN